MDPEAYNSRLLVFRVQLTPAPSCQQLWQDMASSLCSAMMNLTLKTAAD